MLMTCAISLVDRYQELGDPERQVSAIALIGLYILKLDVNTA